MSCITQNEMNVLAGDMNGHVGSSNIGYNGTHDGFGYGDSNADRLNLLICNTLFMKQESQFITYTAGHAKSMVEYNIV